MPAHPRVVNVRAEGGLPAGAVHVGRANPTYGLARSRFANPYRPALLDAARHELAGRALACWCAPGPCHASVLAWVADGLAPAEAAARTLEGEAEQASLLA